MPGYQPRHDTDPVWFNGTQINTLTLTSAQAGVRVTAIHGWDDRPDVRDVRELRAGQDGEYADNLYLGGRTITIEGEVYGSTWADLQSRKRALAALFQPSSAEKLLKIPDPTATAFEDLWSEHVDELAPTAWWRFNDLANPPSDNSYDAAVLARADTVGLWKLNETSGTVAANSVAGGAYPGTITGPTLGTHAGPLIGSSDTAFDFDGSNDIVAVTYNAALNPAAFTIAAWVYRDADDGNNDFIVNNRSGANTGQLIYIAVDDTVRLQLGDGVSGSETASTSAIAAGRWYFVVGTFDGTTAKVYINGVLEGSNADAFTPNGSGNLNFGATSNSFNGALGRISLHNAALTASEIGALFVLGRPVADTQGNHPGGMIDAPASATGAITGDANACFDFDGSNDAVVIPYSASLNAATFSISGWIKRDADSGAAETIINSRGSNTGYSVRISSGDKLGFVLADGAAASENSGTTSLAVGTWYHIAVTYDGTNARVYVNGALELTAADAYSANTTTALYIGTRDNGTERFNGKIDELTYHGSTVLTDAQIANLYDVGMYDHEVYETTGMYSYERSSCRVIEAIQFGETLDPCCQTFQVVLRASDPRIYSDTATSTDSGTTGSSPRTATVDQGGTHPTNPTLTVTGPTTSLWTVSEPTSRLNLSFSGLTLTSNESVELDVQERTATIIGPYQDLRTRRSECVALWRFNESAGTTADNYDGNATYDGTYTNGPTLNQTGPFTNVPSVVLDGTNDYITVSYNANLNPAAMTFEGWFYVNALPVGSSTAIASSGQTSEGWEVGLTTDGFLNLYIGNGTTFANWGTTSVTTATWHHLAVVVDASADTALMYIDGIKANEINPSVYSGGRNVTVNTARPLWWGRSNVGTQYLNGRVSAFALYNSAYSAQQVYDLYTSTGTASELSGYGYLVGNSARWAPLETSSSTYTLTGGSFGSGTKLNVTYRDARL
jgi:hypothetical protein